MLLQAIGDLLPSAIGVALSPVPIIAVIVMLGTPRARTNGLAFAFGWIAGLVVVSVVVLALSSGADDAGSATSTGVDWIQVLVGVLFLVMAVGQWRRRPAPGVEPELPEWMAVVDTFDSPKSLGLGALLSGLNPKNLALTAAGAASIAQVGLDGGQSAIAVAVFVAIASLTTAGPVVFFVVATDKAAAPLAAMKSFMSDHSAVIMMVVLLVLGGKLLGQGLGALST